MKYKNSTKGFILKKNFYKDTSVFLEIFSYDFWKKSFFIKNFKKSKKINSAFLNIWSEISFDFSEKLNVWNISEVSFIDWFENLDEDWLRFLSYFLWLTSKFLSDDEKNLEIYLFLKKFFLVFKKFFCDEKKIFFKIYFEVNFFIKLWYLKNSKNNFLNFLQKNEIENILNTKISEDEKPRVWKIFDEFLMENWCEKIMKIFEN